MSEIEIINGMPAIFTKDKEWAEKHTEVRPGAIVVLPEDAVLVRFEEEYQVTQTMPPIFMRGPIEDIES